MMVFEKIPLGVLSCLLMLICFCYFQVSRLEGTWFEFNFFKWSWWGRLYFVILFLIIVGFGVYASAKKQR